MYIRVFSHLPRKIEIVADWWRLGNSRREHLTCRWWIQGQSVRDVSCEKWLKGVHTIHQDKTKILNTRWRFHILSPFMWTGSQLDMSLTLIAVYNDNCLSIVLVMLIINTTLMMYVLENFDLTWEIYMFFVYDVALSCHINYRLLWIWVCVCPNFVANKALKHETKCSVIIHNTSLLLI